ncbi:MAG: hypothetical protein IKU16_07110 [Muribaculaceae bacterium]|nr:hypothetical protein [Muribaculaceae bacterium]
MKSQLLSVALVGALGLSTFSASAINPQEMKQRFTGVDSPVKALSYNPGDEALSLKKSPSRIKASEDPVASVTDAYTWGFLEGPNGGEWFYSQSYTFDGWYYTATEVTLYDENYQELGKLSIDMPEGMMVNQIQPFGAVTNNFFERNTSTNEIAIFHHAVTEDYMGKFWVDVYSLETGEKVVSYDCETAIFFDATTGFSTNMQLMVCNPDGEGNIVVDIYGKGTYNDPNPVVIHSFVIEEKLVNYMDSSYISAYNLNGEIYYLISHYEKEYMQPSDDIMSDPVATPDNTFVIKLYNADFENINTVNIPIEGEEDAYYSFVAYGAFSTCDFSKGRFSGDDKFNYIITRYDYITANDSYIYHFDVYNEDGEKVANIGNRVAGWIHMSSLKGFEDQVGLIKTEVGEGMIEMIDIPSCSYAVALPGIIDNRLISTNMDRCLVDGDYQYVISVSQGDIDAEGNVISSIGWYDKNGQIDHYTDFNIGPDAEYFSAYINNEILNPYLVDSDEAREYVFITKVRNNSGNLSNVLCVAKEDGTYLHKFTDDDVKGLYFNGGFIASNTANASLFIAYLHNDTDIYTVDFYKLPLEKFEAGGDGTEQNPYLITSAGDLEQVANDPDAYYALAADIDMKDLSGSWNVIPTFAGHFDGRNHAIKNMYISCDSDYCGLFGMLDAESSVNNIVFIDPIIEMRPKNYYTGILAGMSMKATVDNIHIFNAKINGHQNGNTIGGLIGEANYYTAITSCSINDLVIDAPNATYVGGVAGDTRTSTTIKACHVGNLHTQNSSITGLSEVGGVVGITGSDCDISNCKVKANISAGHSVGGVVGNSSGRADIFNNIVEGMITATSTDLQGNTNAGGICGYLEPDWAQSSGAKVIYKNIAALRALNVAGNAKGIGRIVGWTVDQVKFGADEEPIHETGLAGNLANADMQLGGNTITSDNAASVNGADLVMTEADKALYETYGFAFGSKLSKPWKESDYTPDLYFSGLAKYLTFDIASINAVEGNTESIVLTVYGADAEDIDITSSDDNVAKVASIEVIDAHNIAIVIEILAEGTANITAKNDCLEAVCQVIGVSSVEELKGYDTTILFDGTMLSAQGAKSIAIYSVDGIKVAETTSETMIVEDLPASLYIAVATVDGKQLSRKIVIR